VADETTVQDALDEVQDTRKPRDLETREQEARVHTWRKPDALPSPDPQDGWSFRWIRESIRGEPDDRNVSKKFREGWKPVSLDDHPELMLFRSDINTRFPNAAVIGGLMLCKIPTEIMVQRRAALAQESAEAMQGVDSNFMRQEDSRMPLLAPERSTRVTFGGGS